MVVITCIKGLLTIPVGLKVGVVTHAHLRCLLCAPEAVVAV